MRNILFEPDWLDDPHRPRSCLSFVVGEFDYSYLVGELTALQERTGREICLVSMRPDEFRREQKSGFIRQVLSEPMQMLIGSIGDN